MRWAALGSSVWLLGGCGLRAQGQRYDAMSAELARIREASRESAPGDAGGLSLTDDAAPERLSRAKLVEAVLARNPSVTSAREAWRAALAAFPQATALDDPMLEYGLAPLSIGASQVDFGQMVQLGQRFSWPGKRALAGQVTLAEAEAAREDYEATRLRLALMASLLYDQYYAVERSLEINGAHRLLLEEVAASALAQYEAARGGQQEPLQAELELAEIARQRIALTADRGVLVAQLNGLLHREPDAPLPPPHVETAPPLDEPPPLDRLVAEALDARPELAASAARVRGREAAIDLARRDYYPELGATATYNTMWMDPEHRLMVGVSLNVPVQVGARRGAVTEARAAHAQSDAELAALADAVRVEVATARERLMAALDEVRLYRERLLPTAEAQIEAARIGYTTGRSGFQALVDAERSLRTLELGYQMRLAELGQRRAELDRAVGRVPAGTGEDER
jgi:outer membrane protein TolC